MVLSALFFPFENRQSKVEKATYGYDGKNQLTSASGGQTYGYGWDGAGRISGQSAANDYRATGRTNPQTVNLSGTLTATTGSATATSQINGGALGTIRVRAGKLLSTDYYDLSGWQTFTITATVAGAGMGGSDAVTQEVRQIFVPPASESLGYDVNGNRATDAQWTYTWNTGQQLARAVENGSAPGALPMQIDYVYDWLGRRIEKKVSSKAANGTLTQIKRLTWLYDGWLPVREIEYTAADLEKVRRTFTWGPDFTGRRGQEGAGVGGLVEIYEQPRFGAATRTLPYYDCNQNVVGAVDGATGAIVAQFSYGPFGEPISASGSRVDSVKFRFQTRYWDEETSTYNFCFRTLDPKTGFLSRDPLREKSGDVNDRRYCFNDPLRRHDPLGLAAGWALENDPPDPVGKVVAKLTMPDTSFAHENYGFPLLVAEDREFAAELINYTPLAVLTGSAEAITGRNPITAYRVDASQAYANVFLGALGVAPLGVVGRLEGAEMRTTLPLGRSFGVTNLASNPIDALLPTRVAKTTQMEFGFVQAVERQTVARDFYRATTGWNDTRIASHLRGIDFSQPVSIVDIQAGISLTQFNLPGRVGNYYAPAGTPANTLGIYTSGLIESSHTFGSPTRALQSTAASIIDDWSMSGAGWRIEAGGGGTQFFVPNR